MRRSAAALRKHRLRVVRRGAGSPLIVAVVGRRVLVLVLALLFLACAQARAAPRRLADSGQAGGGGGESTEEEGGEEEEEGGEEEEPEWTITWCAYSTTDCSGKTKEDCSVRTDEDMNECIADYPDGLKGYYRLKCGDKTNGDLQATESNPNPNQRLQMAQYDSDTCSDYKCVIDTPEGPFEWDEDGKWEKCTIPWPEMWGNDECFPIKGRGSIKMTWEGDPCPNPIAKLGWIVLFVIFGGMGTAVTLAVVCQAKSEEKWCWRRKFDRPVNDLSKFEQIDAIKADEEETKKKWEEHHEKQRQIDERHSAIRSVAEQATIPGSVLSDFKAYQAASAANSAAAQQPEPAETSERKHNHEGMTASVDTKKTSRSRSSGDNLTTSRRSRSPEHGHRHRSSKKEEESGRHRQKNGHKSRPEPRGGRDGSKSSSRKNKKRP